MALLDHSIEFARAQIPPIVRLDSSASKAVTVVGDVHGQFFDVLNIFSLNGLPSPSNQYLFNGDLVDRGWWGTEILLTLLSLKAAFPDSVHINAGNHEDHLYCYRMGFRSEVLDKYSSRLYMKFLEYFEELPLATVLNNEIFVVHGGLPPPNVDLNWLKILPKRSKQRHGSIFDQVTHAMLFSDPFTPPKKTKEQCRGLGFGPKETADFLKLTNLHGIIRSHECVDGLHQQHDGRVATLFSAAGYCRAFKNRGAIARFEADSKTPKYVFYDQIYDPHYDGDVGHFNASMERPK